MAKNLVKKSYAPHKSRVSSLTEVIYEEWISFVIIAW